MEDGIKKRKHEGKTCGKCSSQPCGNCKFHCVCGTKFKSKSAFKKHIKRTKKYSLNSDTDENIDSNTLEVIYIYIYLFIYFIG